MIKLELVVNQSYEKMAIEIWAIEDRGHEIFNYHTENGHLVKTPVKSELTVEGLQPLLSLPMVFGEQFLKAVTEYNSKRGIKTTNENLIEGKLQATVDHLSDMQMIVRKLLKLNEKS